MKLPDDLIRDRDFMRLLRMSALGATDAERYDVDTLVALAFLKGESRGIERAIESLPAKQGEA